MPSRERRFLRKNRTNGINVETLIERLRKIRALNATPADVGMDEGIEWLDKYGRAYFLIGRIGQ
jgi:hypothetical protein